MSNLQFDIPNLEEHLRRLIAQVPLGRVATCGSLAGALGSPMAALWVGHYSMHHRHDEKCPCHRIVRAGGKLGPFISDDVEEKARKLRGEGVEVSGDLIDLSRFGFDVFAGSRPLEVLRQIQHEMAANVKLSRRTRIPELVGGVDVSYPKPNEGVAAYALVESGTGQLVWSTVVRRRIEFPYVSTFLSFRELPILLDLIEEVRGRDKLSPVVMVDGSGVLHQFRAGIACHLGVAADLPTVGVTKKFLCGKVDIEGMDPSESRPVEHDGRTLGVAVRPTAGSERPIFISPGHRLNLAFAERLTRKMLFGRRLPEPIYWADRLSRHPSQVGFGPAFS